MEKIHFVSDWLIRPIEGRDALPLVNTAVGLGGFLFVGNINEDENGLFIGKLLAQFPSTESFEEFRPLGAKIGIDSWYPISIKDDQGTFFNLSWVQALAGFVESSKLFGLKNQELLAKLNPRAANMDDYAGIT